MKFVYVHGYPTSQQIEEVWHGPFQGHSIHVHSEYLEGGYTLTYLTTESLAHTASSKGAHNMIVLEQFVEDLLTEKLDCAYMGAEEAKLSDVPIVIRSYRYPYEGTIEWYGALWGYDELVGCLPSNPDTVIHTTESGRVLDLSRHYEE